MAYKIDKLFGEKLWNPSFPQWKCMFFYLKITEMIAHFKIIAKGG
jgi:hypothetical protein